MMQIVIPDDYQDVVRGLACFAKLDGHAVTVYHDSVIDEELLATRFADADVLVLTRERTAITASLLARLPRLKLIAQTGRGMPHIDLKACTERGISVTAGSGSPYATAELTWALVLAGMRRLPQEIASMRAGLWQQHMGMGLRGRTLGIFGYGKIGSVVGDYGKVFGMRVLVWGRDGSLTKAREAGFETASSQRDLFMQSDVLCLHIKLTPETRGIVTTEDLAAMKPESLLVNTSRAALIAPGALADALKAGRPGFAAVDVYEHEPAREHPLLLLDNVICTPHIGYVERDSYEAFFSEAFGQVVAFAAGAPQGVVNPEALNASG